MEKHYQNIKKFLENTDDIEGLCEGDSVIFIDWREYDEDIVSYFNQKINNQIQIKLQDNGKPYGDDIVLNFKDKSLSIPYDKKMDRDTTIIYINKIINSDYEIRWCADSLGSDTLGFVILEKTMWENLEETLGKEKVHYHFEPISLNKKMFGLEIDEVFNLLNIRTKTNFNF